MHPALRFASLATALLVVSIPLCPISSFLSPAIAQAQTAQDPKAEADRLFQQDEQDLQNNQDEGALRSSPQALVTFQQLKNSGGEAKAIATLDSAYGSLSQDEKAIFNFPLATIAQAHTTTAESQREANKLFQLGSTQFKKSQFQPALVTFQNALAIWKQLHNLGGQGDTLLKIGQVYEILGQYTQALDSYRQAAEAFSKIGEKENQAGALYGVGIVYMRTGKYSQAITSFQNALILLPGSAGPLNGLGLAYTYLGQYDQALKFHQQSLEIRRANGWHDGEATSLLNIGEIYALRTQYKEAFEYDQKALNIYKQTSDLAGQVRSLNGIGSVYQALKQYSKSMVFFQDALNIARKINDLRGQGTILNNIGETYYYLEQYSQAMAAYEQSVLIRRKINDHEGESKTLSNIGQLLAKQNQSELAIVFYKQSVNLTEKIRDELRSLPRNQQESYTQTVVKTYRSLADLLLKKDRILEAQEVLELLKIQEFDNTFKEERGQRQPITFRKAELELLKQFNTQQQSAILAAQELTALQNKPETQLTKQDRDRITELNHLQAKLADDFIQFINSNEVKILVEKLRRKDSGSIDPETLEALRNKFSNQLARLPNTALFYPLILDDRLELILSLPTLTPFAARSKSIAPASTRRLPTFALLSKTPGKTPNQAPRNSIIYCSSPLPTICKQPKLKRSYIPPIVACAMFPLVRCTTVTNG
jgi:tetratricopeptide (TPR) repeat protein